MRIPNSASFVSISKSSLYVIPHPKNIEKIKIGILKKYSQLYINIIII